MPNHPTGPPSSSHSVGVTWITHDQPEPEFMSGDSTRDPVTFNKLWSEAVAEQKRQLGDDNIVESDSAREIRNAVTHQELMAVVDRQAHSLEMYHKSGGKVEDLPKKLVRLLVPFAESVTNDMLALPCAKAIMVAVIGLLEATAKITKLCHAVQHILSKIMLSLECFQSHLQTSAPVAPELHRIFVESAVVILDILALIIKSCEPEVNKKQSIFSSFKRRNKDYLSLLLDRDDVKKRFEDLQRLVDAPSLRIAGKTDANGREIQKGARHANGNWDAKALSEEYENIRAWIGPVDVNLSHNATLRFNDSPNKTCQWLFEDEEFKNWKSRSNSVYCILGAPGCGKSALCSMVVEQLKEEREISQEEDRFALAYFYFNSTIDHSDTWSSHRALIKSLVFQIACSSSKCWDLLQQERKRAAKRKRPWDEDLVDILGHLLRIAGTSFIVIDALDECRSHDSPSSDEQACLLAFLKRLYDLELPGLHLFVTTRPDDISEYLDHFKSNLSVLTLHEDNRHSEDLRRYISAKLSDQGVFNWRSETIAKAEELLHAKAQGLYLWVNLQLWRLRQCKPDTIDRTLEQLPEGLEATYADVLHTFSPNGSPIPRVRNVLQFIAFARRPLTVNEVVDALSFDAEAQSFDVNGRNNVIENPETFILRHLPTLVEIVTFENQARIVQFIHFSVKEYFISNDKEADTHSKYCFDQYVADITITSLCLASLNPKALVPHIRSYAAGHWFKHATPSTSSGSDMAEHTIAAKHLDEALRGFLHPESAAFAYWDRKQSTALHCAAHLGLHDHTKRLLSMNHYSIDVLDSRGNTPLFRAAAKAGSDGHIRTMDHLLGNGADITIQRAPNKCSVLHLAANAPSSGEVIDYLITKGASPDALQDDGNTPLHIAATFNSEKAVEALIKNGADKDAANKRGQTPLHICAIMNCRLAARSILEHGAFPSFIDSPSGYTPLHWAVLCGNAALVRILLEYGADAWLGTSSEDKTALHFAAWRNHLDICEILLGHDVHLVTATDQDAQTPLHTAVMFGSHDIVALLVSSNAAVDALDSSGISPLQYAQSLERPEVVRVLEDHISRFLSS